MVVLAARQRALHHLRKLAVDLPAVIHEHVNPLPISADRHDVDASNRESVRVNDRRGHRSAKLRISARSRQCVPGRDSRGSVPAVSGRDYRERTISSSICALFSLSRATRSCAVLIALYAALSTS